MEPKWTDEQLDAINVKNRAAIVSAAAGSGKTAVLVEKLLRILSDRDNPVSADKIVVVTFTKDAAAQMKQRLTEKLSEASAADPSNEWILSQQALIPSAKISTINSFCFDLIRANAYQLDVDSGFRILDGPEDDVIASQAAGNVTDKWFEERGNDIQTLIRFFTHDAKDESSLIKSVLELRSKFLALPFPRMEMDRIVERYSSLDSIKDDPLVDIYCEYAADVLRRSYKLYSEAYEIIQEAYDGYEEEKKVSDFLSNYHSEYNQFIKAIEAISSDPTYVFRNNFVDIKSNLKSFSSIKVNGSNIEFDKSLIDCAQKQRSKAQKLLDGVQNVFTEEDIRADFELHANICSLLFEYLRDILDEEEKLKSEKNCLGFSDAEQLACRLLCEVNGDAIEKTPLAKALSDEYSIVMIDEFQDSTAVQELIFRMLSRDGTADRPGTDFFAVGDVKQSIYRFRQADPRLFIKDLKNSVPYADDGSSKPSHILLNRNFRSSEGVIEFVNAVFFALMSEKNGGLDYNNDHMLIKGADIQDDFGPTEIIRLPECAADDTDNSESTDNSDENKSSSDSVLNEANAVAHRIKQMLDNDTIHDKDGTERKLRPSDFCILLRTTGNTAIYINALEKLGISAEGSAEESYLESREISILINLLRCIDNPTLDIPVAAVLMSPMFMFTAEDMAQIRFEEGTSFYAKILAAAEESSNADVTLKSKCGNFISTFGALREYAASGSIEKLIGYIYDRTDFMSVISVYKDSRKKKANLRLLPAYAAAYDKNSTGGLSGFLRYIDSMKTNSKSFEAASAVTVSTDAVSIKSIHKSKGLEYPFVFLCNTWKQFNTTDMNQSIVFTSDYGPAFKIADSDRNIRYESFPRKAMSILIGRNFRNEEMMLLYVALTRAKNKLFITSKEPAKAKIESHENLLALVDPALEKQNDAASDAKSMADWLDIVLALFKEKDGKYTFGNCSIVYTDGVTDTENEEVGGECEFAPSSSEYAEIFRKNMADSYDYTLSQTAAKLTVSEIAKKHEAPAREIFTQSEEAVNIPRGISAAAAGTAVHAFMQYADIRMLYSTDRAERPSKIRAEAERICSLGLISDLEAKCVSVKKVSGFLDSDLCARMMRSPELYREKKFLVKISDLNLDDEDLKVYNSTEGMLQGVADCVFEENGSYILVDYKTDHRVDAVILAQRYTRQLSLYASALSAILEKPVTEGYLYSFDMGTSVKTEI